MSNLDDERLGQTNFKLKQEVAVERSLAKIRHHLGRDWAALNSEEIADLSWLMGELWMGMGFMAWEQVAFDSISLQKVDQLIELTKGVRRGEVENRQAIERAINLLNA